MNTAVLSPKGTVALTYNELVSIEGGNQQAYECGRSLGQEARKALDTVLLILFPWL